MHSWSSVVTRLHRSVFFLIAIVLTTGASPALAECIAQINNQWVENNSYILNFSYYGASPSIPGCATGLGTWLSIRWDGGPYKEHLWGSTFHSSAQVSSYEGFPCWNIAEGQHTIELKVDCQTRVGNTCVPDTGHATFTFNVTQGIKIVDASAGRPQSGSVPIKTRVAWRDSWQNIIKVHAYAEMNKTTATSSGNEVGVEPDGSASFNTAYNPAKPYIKLVAKIEKTEQYTCHKYDFRIIAVSDNKCDCPNCGDCVGGPVRVSNGNMRYSDTDPLPVSGTSLTRTYDSTNADNGWFGHGWVSFLDEWLRTETEVDGSTTIAIGTEGNDRYFFNGKNGVFRQLWPVGSSTSALSSDGGGGYVLRAYGSGVEHSFDASGRIYKLRQLNNGREVNITYDANGLITRVADSWGNWAWNVTTNATAHRITTIAVEGTPISWGYSYSTAGNLETVQENGVTWRTYAYNGAYGGALSEIRDAGGNLIESHSYGPDGATTSIGQTDDISSITYNMATSDPDMTITRVTSATGAETDYYEKSIAGRVRTDHIEGGCTSCTSRNAIYVYDVDGRLVREQNARGYVTEKSYDSLNRVISETVALKPADCDPETTSDHCRMIVGLDTALLEPTAATVTRTFTYDTTWYDRVASIETPSLLHLGWFSSSRIETMSYDPQSGEVVMHNISGLAGGGATVPSQQDRTTMSVALYDGTEGAAFVPGGAFQSAWLSLPQPIRLRKSIDGPRDDVNDVTTFVYYPVDASVTAVLRGHLAAVRNAAGHITRYEDYDVFGNAQRVVDPNGVASESAFDHLGRVLTTTIKAVSGCDTAADPLCATDLTTTRVYSPATGPLASQADANGNVTVYEYDSRGRIATISRGPSATSLKERIAYTYDTATGRKSVEQYLGMESGSWVEKKRESFAYDSLSRLVTQTHPDTTTVAYTYDEGGAVATVKDENHSTPNTTYTYDPAQRLASVQQTLAAASGGSVLTSYAYDIAGNLTQVTDPNGNNTTYVYDDFGSMTFQMSPVTGQTTYSYDLAGNLSATEEENGTTARTYDELNRVLSASSSRSSGSEEVTWTYDDASADRFGIGRVATMTSPDSSTTYSYERRGLLRQEDLSIWGDPFVQSYRYDAAGNRTSIGYPSGRVVTYGFDFAGRPVTAAGLINETSTDYVTAASYRPFGPLTSLTFGNGAVEARSYDQRYQPSTLQLTSGGTTLASYSYGLDSTGNITQISDLTDSTYNRTLAYDDLNRLVTANSGTSLWGSGTYTYDSMGNMQTSTLGSRSRSFTYTGTTPLIANATDNGIVTSMSYDLVGNELKGPNGASSDFTDTRTYSPRNLLQQIDIASLRCMGPLNGEACAQWGENVATISNAYDGRGVRVAMTQRNSLPPYDMRAGYFFYTPELAPLNIVRQVDGTQADIISFAGRPVAQESIDTPWTRFTFTDHLGTAILQMDTTAAVVWRAEYEPFGDVYAMRAGYRNEQPLRFPGQQVAFTNQSDDEESYNIFRWYRTGWGRYTQADPIGTTVDFNIFRYVASNPASLIDPLGLYCTKDFVAHYLGRSGTPVNLRNVDLLSTFLKSIDVSSTMKNVRYNAAVRVGNRVKELCAGSQCKVSGVVDTGEDSAFVNVYLDNTPCVGWPIGSTMLLYNTRCPFTGDCKARTYSYSCTTKWKLRDRFTNPLSQGEPGGNAGKPNDILGVPYDIVADWDDVYYGGGSW